MVSLAPETEYTRLHITPFDAKILTSIVPSSILPHARSISYHTIQTQLDKPYGYIELPAMDATKLSKKLNGSILKGTKVKIETARPRKEITPEQPAPAKEKREKKKRKRDEIPAVELQDRNVERGWTTPGKIQKRSHKKDGDKKSGEKMKVKSKYTESKECLFKTKLPTNIAAHAEKAKGKGTERVIHEFAKREKYASFLRGPAGEKLGKGVKEFIEGKGWVDEDGEVVEVVVKKRKIRKSPEPVRSDVGEAKRSRPSAQESSSEKLSKAEGMEKNAPDHDASDVDSSDESLVASSSEESELINTAPAAQASDTSTSGSSSESDSESYAEESPESKYLPKSPELVIQSSVSTPAKSRPVSSSGLTISIPETSIVSASIHPLEALYKKPKIDDGPAPERASFSFFGGDNEDEEDDIVPEVYENAPLTPFTQRDFEFRGQRSAAPTPDTAHANKRFLWTRGNDHGCDDDDEDEGPSSPVRKDNKSKGKETTEPAAKDESDFTKWFYENRGDTNRAWKKRRKTVAKEKRQRENRKRGDRAD
ncbi:hypothetical protein BJ878DRAFT_322582 [Calycina marina]|uniref:Uncharacterized protein n=1 Tax=Calycina marina TaxID=1763456 RepID=A0A9P8CB07_9HELO|nr:hypothetical protein BJ878DRAFT_322582 [Calycina marina]